jgi:hypothetical protein
LRQPPSSELKKAGRRHPRQGPRPLQRRHPKFKPRLLLLLPLSWRKHLPRYLLRLPLKQPRLPHSLLNQSLVPDLIARS